MPFLSQMYRDLDEPPSTPETPSSSANRHPRPFIAEAPPAHRLPPPATRWRGVRGDVVWGDERPGDRGKFANLWQGKFPQENTAIDGYEGTAPVKSFPANGYGLYDMAGNVWEWCGDWYQRDLYRRRAGKGELDNPTGPDFSLDAQRPFTPQRVQKGGSFLCNDSYCSRYRPSARHGCSADTGMSHVGFRCVRTKE